MTDALLDHAVGRRAAPGPAAVRRARFGLGAWCAFLGASIWVLHLAGRAGLAAPSWSDLPTWVRDRGVALALVAVIRLGALVVAWYLVVTTVVGVITRRMASTHVAVVDRVTPAFLRLVLDTARSAAPVAGLGLALVPVLLPDALRPGAASPVPGTIELVTPPAGGASVDALPGSGAASTGGAPGSDSGPADGSAAPGRASAGGSQGPGSGTAGASPGPGDASAGGSEGSGGSGTTDASRAAGDASADRSSGPGGASADGSSGPGAGTVDASPGPGDASAPAPRWAEETWTVAPGEHFWSIAETVLADAWGRPPSEAETSLYWTRLIARNDDRLVAPGEPDLLYPGQVLALPAPDSQGTDRGPGSGAAGGVGSNGQAGT